MTRKPRTGKNGTSQRYGRTGQSQGDVRLKGVLTSNEFQTMCDLDFVLVHNNKEGGLAPDSKIPATTRFISLEYPSFPISIESIAYFIQSKRAKFIEHNRVFRPTSWISFRHLIDKSDKAVWALQPPHLHEMRLRIPARLQPAPAAEVRGFKLEVPQNFGTRVTVSTNMIRDAIGSHIGSEEMWWLLTPSPLPPESGVREQPILEGQNGVLYERHEELKRQIREAEAEIREPDKAWFTHRYAKVLALEWRVMDEGWYTLFDDYARIDAIPAGYHVDVVSVKREPVKPEFREKVSKINADAVYFPISGVDERPPPDGVFRGDEIYTLVKAEALDKDGYNQAMENWEERKGIASEKVQQLKDELARLKPYDVKRVPDYVHTMPTHDFIRAYSRQRVYNIVGKQRGQDSIVISGIRNNEIDKAIDVMLFDCDKEASKTPNKAYKEPVCGVDIKKYRYSEMYSTGSTKKVEELRGGSTKPRRI
jgi:hypothetical protein